MLINPSQTHTAKDQELIRSNPKVFVMDSPDPVCDLTTWLRNAGQLAAKNGVDQIGDGWKEGTQEFPAQITIQFADRPYIVGDNQRLEINEVRFSGILKRAIHACPTVIKALFKLGESNPLAGCFITEFPRLGLVALIVTAHRTLELALVPISDRNKNKIYKQRIGKKRR